MKSLLWTESLGEALRDTTLALGGYKRVGAELWPNADPQEAGRRLSHCLDPERRDKLALDEVMLILKAGRQVGCHVGMAFIAQAAGYSEPVPVGADCEREQLQREFVQQVKALESMARRLDRIQAHNQQLRPWRGVAM